MQSSRNGAGCSPRARQEGPAAATQLYRQMFNKDLYLLAYGNIYSNKGAMTPGASEETADGMSEEKIDQIIEAMRHERYRFSPARRVYIPKKNGKLRPLGLPSWSDKLVGEVVRLLLEAYYEPQFSDRSHGFRKRPRMSHRAAGDDRHLDRDRLVYRGRHLRLLRQSLDHEILLGILAEKIHDQPVPAAYPEHAESRVPGRLGIPRHAQRSSARRRGIPVLSNIYLHKLDEFVEQD